MIVFFRSVLSSRSHVKGQFRLFRCLSSHFVTGLGCRCLSTGNWSSAVEKSGEAKKKTISSESGESNDGESVANTAQLKNFNNSSYCADLVRKHDYESFLCTLLVPGVDARAFGFAVRAFNVEIALIRDQVSQKDIRLRRLGFWRNAINQLFVKTRESNGNLPLPRHPVVLELNRVFTSKKISKKWLVNLVEARERVMNDASFVSIEDLESYCDKSVSSMLYIELEALGIKNVDVDHAASHLGKAIGLANFVRSIPYNAQRRRVLIPQELLTKHKLSQENFIRVSNKEKIQEAVYEIASHAHVHYEKAKVLKSKLPKAALQRLLIGTPTEIYLKRLQNAQFNPYESALSQRYGLLPAHLYYRKLTRTYF